MSVPNELPPEQDGGVFLSYSRSDREYVTKLADWLKGLGVSVWYDHDIDYGMRWKLEIERQLATAEVVVLVLSAAAGKSEWVRREVEQARSRPIPVLPLLLEPEGLVDWAAELQVENVIGSRMPGLAFCLKLPGFLASEQDLSRAMTPVQRQISRRLAAATGRLMRGSTGPGVAALQAELIRVGLEPGPIDGVYGDRTLLAVREFQRRRCHRPTADGIVGPLVWILLANSSFGDLAPADPRTVV